MPDDNSRLDFLEIGDEPPLPPVDASTQVRRALVPVSIIGRPGRGAGEFNSPQGVAVDNWGNLYVADTNNHRIQKITPYHDVYRFEDAGRNPGQLLYPTSVVVDALLCAYVLDAGNCRVQKFGPTWRFEYMFGMEGTQPGCFRSPASITRDSFSNIFVADSQNGRIQKFDASGRFQFQFPGMRADDSGFRPTALALDREYNCWVTDGATHRLIVFNSRGGAIGAIGGAGSEPGRLSDPVAVAIHPEDGTVFVSEVGNARIQAFSPQGECLAIFAGTASSGVEVIEPRGLAVDAEGNLYVADAKLHRVTKLEWR
jgi:DNA-binding beta-propeller fold protein YncE